MSTPDNVYRMNKLFEIFNGAPPRKIPAIADRHPKFADYLLSTADHEVWEFAHAASRFYIERYSQLQEIDRTPSAKFWHKSNVTRLLFYRLMERTASMIAVKNVRVGLPQNELVSFLTKSCRVSDRNVLRTISEAVDAGFIEKTTWWRDERITVCYLSPISIAEYLDIGIQRHFKAAFAAGLPEANQRFDAALEKTEDRQLDFGFMRYV